MIIHTQIYTVTCDLCGAIESKTVTLGPECTAMKFSPLEFGMVTMPDGGVYCGKHIEINWVRDRK